MTLEFGITAVARGGSPPSEQSGLQKPAAVKHHFGFRELLSELNPLQYIPVIGTLFRAVTGDVIPEPVRDVGSLVFSTVIGGPVGAAVNLAELAVEKVSGIDPEKIGDRLLVDVGIGGKHSAAVAVGEVKQPAAVDVHAGWSRAQLVAYGVTTGSDRDLRQGAISGSDVLNGIELGEIQTRDAIGRYAATTRASG